MKQLRSALVLIVLSLQQAFAWGPEGHSIVAEIAQREMQPSTRSTIDTLLNHATLASVSNWADDVKFTTRPETYPWHFADIPLDHDTFSPADCRDKQRPQFGDVCLITALDSLKTALSCGTDDATKRDNLRLVVHLIGDSTQPLHTVDDFTGGNSVMVKVGFCGLAGDVRALMISHSCWATAAKMWTVNHGRRATRTCPKNSQRVLVRSPASELPVVHSCHQTLPHDLCGAAILPVPPSHDGDGSD